MEDFAKVILYPPNSEAVVWRNVLANSVTRHSDGSLSFRHRPSPGVATLRVTVYGTYAVEYPFNAEDK